MKSGLTQMVKKIHEYDAKIIFQIAALGPQTVDNDNLDKVMYGPSNVADVRYKYTAQELTRNEIISIQSAFANSALRAMKAGFNGVQIHYIFHWFYNLYQQKS